MRKWICAGLCLLLVCLLAMPALAASEEPVITLQPQSPNTPHYGVAIYTVKATGTNLSATWYIQWQGSTYNTSNIGSGMQAWEPYAGESYGFSQPDSNTFIFMFEGIERDLDGAYIWCVIEDGHYSVTSQKARISVGNENTPPNIISIPSQLTVTQGAPAEIRCIAQAPDGSQLSYLWYESDTGRIEDIRAVNRGTETSDYLICDTSVIGTRNYICFISTSAGGFANSSFVPVTVTSVTKAPTIQTATLPDATVGQPYSTKISANGDKVVFEAYYNPGQANDLDKTGLTISRDGTLSGTPKAAGTYGFCICASNSGGEDYKVYTLTVKEAEAQPTTPTTETTEPVSTPTTAPSAPSAATQTTEAKQDAESESGLPWWSLVVVAVAAAGAGVGVALVLTKKKS